MREQSIWVRNTLNGFVAEATQCDKLTGERRNFTTSFESFETLSRHLKREFSVQLYDKNSSAEPEIHVDAMRDELGELRRFKERAITRDEETQKRLNETIDSLNKAREYMRNVEAANGGLLIQIDDLQAFIAKMAKKEKKARKRARK